MRFFLFINMSYVWAYREVLSDTEMFSYAEEITLPTNSSLKGVFDTYNSSDKTYQKCFKIYLTTDDKLQLFNIATETGGLLLVHETTNIQSAKLIGSNLSVEFPLLKFIFSQGGFKEGYYYLIIYDSAETAGFDISVKSIRNDYSPTITWQSEETATGYRIDIYYENGEVITSLNFDASGNYVGIVQKSLS
ncbi:MAG: hypothetical protein LBU90_10215, partial [Bacteroidales bacterium]|nr:hypothetical protein [Bacteroidales bacterium]